MEGTQRQLNELDQLAGEGAAEDVAGEYIPGSDGPGPEQQQGPQHSTADVLAPVLQITFGLIASRRGQHWALSDGEAKEAAEAYGTVIDKYFPDVNTGPELTAVIVTLAIVGPRLGQDRVVAARKAKAEREAENKEQGGVDGDTSE